MQGYKPQYDDHAHYTVTMGTAAHPIVQKAIPADMLEGHKNADEILAICNETYRPESLHNNGDVHEEYNPERLMLVRVTHEKRTRSHADLAEQAGFNRAMWDVLSDSYTSFVRYTERWRKGYNPEVIKPDMRFQRRVNETMLRMKKSAKLRLKLSRRARQLGIIK